MSPPAYEELREAMTGLADTVTPVDLQDRAVRTSRRLRRWRVTASVAAVLVVVGGGTATATHLLSTSTGIPQAAGSGSGSAGCAPATAPVDPAPSPFYGPTEKVPAPNTGPLFYLAASGTSTALVSWTPGKGKPELRRPLPLDALDNANVSPDGKWVSWVTTDGALHLGAVGDGKNDRVLRSGVDGRLLEPVWSHDSTRLLVREASGGRVGTLDVATGTFTPLPASLTGARHAVWAADGTAIAFIASDGGIVVAKPDGTGQRRIPAAADYLKEGRKVASLQSMSGTADGDSTLNLFVTAPHQEPNGCRSLVSNTTIRTSNGMQGEDEAQAGGRYREYQAAFRGQHFSHVDRDMGGARSVALIGGNGEFLGSIDEPDQLRGYLLLNG